MAAKFGTSGLRGLANELIGGVAFGHVRAFANRMLESGRIAQGANVYMAQDHRASSPALALETAIALRACDLVPVDCGNIPTPALALYAMSRNAAAIMVTGSHIPANRNGIKFYRPDGEIDKADEAAIVAGAAKDLATPEHSNAQIAHEGEIALAQYFARYAGVLPPDALRGQKIGVYQHSSVARDFLMLLIAHFGGEPIALDRSEHFIPIDTEAVDAETLLRMSVYAKSLGLNAIISTDADADRPLVLDENGAQIRGDILGIIAAKALQADFIAVPVTSNSAIGEVTGAQVKLTTVGSPFVIAAMEKGLATGYKTVVGFEPNGGFLMASDARLNGANLPALMTRDSTLPILLALQAGGGSLSSFVARLNLPIALGDRLQNFATETGAALVASLTNDAAARTKFVSGFGAVSSINTIDGLRMTLDTGVILHLRPSGNAPEMRCYVEAKDTDTAKTILAEALLRISTFG
ncbi:MAG: phosphomannomutase [Notoacmeibacter sp.]